tara:strand:+ start:478 stop:627 length:150 start_codon:yes stop_codon:yes gene_type:complete
MINKVKIPLLNFVVMERFSVLESFDLDFEILKDAIFPLARFLKSTFISV